MNNKVVPVSHWTQVPEVPAGFELRNISGIRTQAEAEHFMSKNDAIKGYLITRREKLYYLVPKGGSDERTQG